MRGFGQETVCSEPALRLLDNYALRPRQEVRRLACGRIVARHERDGHAEPSGYRRIEANLANQPPVYRHGLHGVRVPCMVGDCAVRAEHRVIADETGSSERVVDSLHHAERLRAAPDQARGRMKVFDQDVAAVVMRVTDEDMRRAARDQAVNRGVHIGGHQGAEAWIIGAFWQQLGGGDEPRHPLHVCRNKDPHACRPLPQFDMRGSE